MKNSLDRLIKLLFSVKEQRVLTIRPYLYEIGQGSHPFNLVFDQEPSADLYYNSIFIKILSYGNTNQAISCLSYHLAHFDEKKKFLEFFENDVIDVMEILQGGVTMPSDKRKQRILSSCLKWVKEEKKQLIRSVETAMRDTIEAEISDLIIRIKDLRIEVHPTIDPKKLIFLLLLLQRRVIDEKGVGVLKFKHTVELPHLLKLFSPFSQSKLDSIRKQTSILAAEENLEQNCPSYLLDALTRYFYQETIRLADATL